MLQDLFPRDHRRYEGSRFWGELEALADWLAAQGHLRHPLRLHLYRVRKVLDGCDRFQPGGMFKEEALDWTTVRRLLASMTSRPPGASPWSPQ